MSPQTISPAKALRKEEKTARRQSGEYCRSESRKMLVMDRLNGLTTSRKQLVSTVSHELRTPIAAIRAAAESLDRGLADARIRNRCFKIIESHADRLSRLIDDLLAVAELEWGKREPKPEVIPLRSSAQQSVKEISAAAARKGVSIRMEIPDGIELWIDPAHLKRIFQNLLDNAVKYNRRGGSIFIEGKRTGERRARISIRDTGIGIHPRDLLLVFQPFHRTETARAREIPGTGLGLYIAKKIVESNGGRIWAENAKGLGSVFYFRLPLARSSKNIARLNHPFLLYHS